MFNNLPPDWLMLPNHWEISLRRKVLSCGIKAPVLKYFSQEKKSVLQCDASEDGLEACLMQAGHQIAYASRALTPTEIHYAQIEKELLSVVFGVKKFSEFLYGPHFVVETWHTQQAYVRQWPKLHKQRTLSIWLVHQHTFNQMVKKIIWKQPRRSCRKHLMLMLTHT